MIINCILSFILGLLLVYLLVLMYQPYQYQIFEDSNNTPTTYYKNMTKH